MARVELAIPGAMRSAKAPKGGGGGGVPKGLPDALKISHGADGGHIVEHQFNNAPSAGKAASFAFGPGEGQQMLAHVARNMGVSRPPAAPRAPRAPAAPQAPGMPGGQ